MMAAGSAGATGPRTTFASLVALIVSVLPAFMLGGVAVLVRQDLGFSEARLGMAVSTFYIFSAIAAVAGGGLSERLGGIGALRAGVLVSTVSLLGLALLTGSWFHLVAWLAVGGLANAVLQPATNLAIVRAVPLHRQALALGLKQTNGPLGTLIAGVSAPLIGLTLGWRWAFAAGALFTVLFFLTCPPASAERRPVAASCSGSSSASPSRLTLLLLAAGGGCGVATSTSLVGFFMESAVTLGHTIAFAGACLATGSALGAVARLGWGWIADRRGLIGDGLVATLLCIGSVAFFLLAHSRTPAMLLIVAIAVFVTGWGWPGLLYYVVVRLAPEAPGKASGVVNVGVFIGGIVGPLATGFLVERFGYPLAWAVVAGLAVLAGMLVLSAGRFAARHRAEPHAPTEQTG